MSYIGYPYSVDQISGQIYQYEKLTGDGSTTAFTINSYFSNAASVFVFINGVQQNPIDSYGVTSNYVAGTTTLTFVSAPFNGDEILVRYNN